MTHVKLIIVLRSVITGNSGEVPRFLSRCVFSLHNQMEPPSQQHMFFQKELWKIQDVLEALSQHKAQRQDGMNPYKHRPEVRTSLWAQHEKINHL